MNSQYERSEADYMRWSANVRNFEEFVSAIVRFFKSHEVAIDIQGTPNERACIFYGKLKGGRFHGIVDIMKLAQIIVRLCLKLINPVHIRITGMMLQL